MEIRNTAISMCAFALLIACTNSGCGVPERPLTEYISAAHKISELIDDDSSILIELPANFARLSIDGQAVLERFGTNQIGVLFIFSRGRGSNFEGYIFFTEFDAINDLPINKNAYGNETIALKPFLIDGERREVAAEIVPTREASLFRVSYRLD